ncbi:MAG: strictosidine synthase [Rhizobiales bacterium]|nr:strictosidine synthase [Hyphomicrobiales bacterium]MBA67355.1 strictosidine synthase [Hyphomicrobiales bacterium]|tara:strand:+ start:206 stop:1342 length:1137 start_codon:yes stop_codon:yes gene_type:complete
MGLADFVATAAGRLMGGRGNSSITVPVMDGPLKPNDMLETAAAVLEEPGIDNLVMGANGLLASAGDRLLRLRAAGADAPQTPASFNAEIMSLAAHPDAAVAIGLDGGGIRLLAADGTEQSLVGGDKINCPTAMIFADANTLLVCNGSRTTGARDWPRDLLELGRSGSVLRVEVASGRVETIRRDLAYPAGLCLTPDGSLIVSEAWRHRLVRLPADGGAPVSVLDDLPAYPGRIVSAGNGGYWLAAFAVRSQLQEFVLREHGYRKMMMAEVEPDYWIAPALASGLSFKEPLQAGGVIRLGIHKPWAPTRSYGLLIQLNDDFAPVASAHSRAGGSRHGVTSVLPVDGNVLVTARGAGVLMRMDSRAFDDVSQSGEKGSVQ